MKHIQQQPNPRAEEDFAEPEHEWWVEQIDSTHFVLHFPDSRELITYDNGEITGEHRLTGTAGEYMLQEIIRAALK
jgi:hypothetical protein